MGFHRFGTCMGSVVNCACAHCIAISMVMTSPHFSVFAVEFQHYVCEGYKEPFCEE